MIVKGIFKALVPRRHHASFRRWWNRVYFFGLSRYCPICGSHLRLFLPHGDPLRSNSVCPVCFSKEPHRLAWLYFKECTNLLAAKLKMLHIAPESGIRILLEKRQNLDYFSGDIKSNQTSLKIDITDLQFDDNSFDVIYACHVLNALEDDMLAMSEAYRVLKPGGWALLQVPVSDEKEATVEETSSGEDRLRSFRDERIYRIYGADYGVRLQRAGFRVRRDPFIERFDEKQRTTYGLQREYLYICTK